MRAGILSGLQDSKILEKRSIILETENQAFERLFFLLFYNAFQNSEKGSVRQFQKVGKELGWVFFKDAGNRCISAVFYEL